MKKVLFFVCLFLLISGVCYASPYITANCSPEADAITGAYYSLNGGTWTALPVVTTCGIVTPNTCTGAGRTICYDTIAIPSGAFTFKARFENAWEVSADSDPLSATKSVPTKPASLRTVR